MIAFIGSKSCFLYEKFLKYVRRGPKLEGCHLPTLEIRVERKGNRVKKETKMGEKKKKNQFCLDRESKPGPVDN